MDDPSAIFDTLNSMQGDVAEQARSDYAAAPLATETTQDASARQYADDTATRAWGRVKAADLSSRGIPSFTTTSGDTKPYTDSTGAALTDSDPKNGVAYDSSGNAVTYSTRNPARTPTVKDAYDGAPTTTDKQGNIYSTPQGLPWVWKGTDPDIQAQYQQSVQDKLNQQGSSALAPYEQQAKTQFTQATKAANQSAKATSQILTQAGASLTTPEGEPIDLKDVDGPTLKGAITDSFNKEYAAPAANETGWFTGSLSSNASAIRADIDNRKQQAMSAADAHIDALSAAQKASDDYDTIQQQRIALQSQKLQSVNQSRVAQGLSPVSIPGLEAAGPTGNNGQSASPDGNASAPVAAPTTAASPPAIPGLEASSAQGGTNPAISPEDHQKLAAALPGPAEQVLKPVQTDASGNVKPESFWGTVGRAFGSKILPAAATAVGGTLGGAAAGAAGIETGPGAVAAALAGDVAGGAAAGYAANKAQRAVMGNQWANQNDAQMAANEKEHPVAAQIGSMVPFLLSALGGGGAALAGKAVAGIGKQGVEDAIATGAQAAAARVAQASTAGARVGASLGAQDPNATPSTVLDSTAKTALTFGATGLFAPAKTILGAVLGKAPTDAAAMALASGIYDSAIHGKPFDVEKIAQEAGGNIPAFVLQNALLGFLGHGMAAKGEPPTTGEKPVSGRVIPPDEGSGSGAIPSTEPDGPTPTGAPPEAKEPTTSEKLNIIDMRLRQIQLSDTPQAFDSEKEHLIAQRDALQNVRTQPSSQRQPATQEINKDSPNLATVEGAETALAQADPEGGMRSIRALRNVVPDDETRRHIILDRLQQSREKQSEPQTTSETNPAQETQQSPVQTATVERPNVADQLAQEESQRGNSVTPEHAMERAISGEGDAKPAEIATQTGTKLAGETRSKVTFAEPDTGNTFELPKENLSPEIVEQAKEETKSEESTPEAPIAGLTLTPITPVAGAIQTKEKTNEPTATPQEDTAGSGDTPAPGSEHRLESREPSVDAEPGGEAAPRATAESIAAHVQKLRRGVLKPHFDLLKTRLESVAPGYAGPSGISANVNPETKKMEIWHDPNELADSHRAVSQNFERQGVSPKEASAKADDAIKASIEEELIHNRQQVFERGGPQFDKTYQTMWRNNVPRVVKDVFKAMRNVKDETDAQKMAELERMIIQYRETGTITEATFGDPFLATQFERLKPFLDAQQSPEVEDNIARVMTLAAEHGEPEKAQAEPQKVEPAPIPGMEEERGPPKPHADKIAETLSELQAARDAMKAGFGDEDTPGEIRGLERKLAALRAKAGLAASKPAFYAEMVQDVADTDEKQKASEPDDEQIQAIAQAYREELKHSDFTSIPIAKVMERAGYEGPTMQLGKQHLAWMWKKGMITAMPSLDWSLVDDRTQAWGVHIHPGPSVHDISLAMVMPKTIPGLENLAAAKPEGENDVLLEREYPDNPEGTTSVRDQLAAFSAAEREAQPVADSLGAGIEQLGPRSEGWRGYESRLRKSGAIYDFHRRSIIWAPIRSGLVSKGLARSVFEEELIHAAQHNVASKEAASVAGSTPTEIIDRKYSDIVGELEKTRQGRAVMMASEHAYGQQIDEPPSKKIPLKMAAPFMLVKIGRALEMERQLVQIRKSGEPTEASMRNATQLMTRWFNQVLHVLKVAAKNPGKQSPMLAESIARVESALRGEADPLHAAKPDTGKPGESESQRENLTREAETAGVTLKVDELKGLLRGDENVMTAVRAKIKARTGKDALYAAKPAGGEFQRLAAMPRQEFRKKYAIHFDVRPGAEDRIESIMRDGFRSGMVSSDIDNFTEGVGERAPARGWVRAKGLDKPGVIAYAIDDKSVPSDSRIKPGTKPVAWVRLTHENQTAHEAFQGAASNTLHASKPLAERLEELREKTGINSVIDDIQKILSPDDRLTAAERKRFSDSGDPNAIGDARKTGIFLDGITAKMARRKQQFEHALKETRALVSKLPEKQQEELMKRVDEGTPLKAGPYKAAFDQVAKMDEERTQEAKDWFAAHGQDHWGNYQNFLKNIVPHYFEDQEQANKVIDQMIRDKKMIGGTGFLKHRQGMTMREIMDWAASKGITLKPKHTNVIDAIADRWTQQERYFGAHEMIERMEANGTGHWENTDYVPKSGEKMVNNIIGNRTVEGADGHRHKQFFFAAEPSAQIVNNYLSRGLRQGHKWVENYFAAANTLNAAQLGLSFFHGSFVTMEGMVSSFALGLEKILHGDLKGLKDMALAPFSTWNDFKLGGDIRKTMLDPLNGNQLHRQTVDAMVDGGFRDGLDSFYSNNDIAKFMDALKERKIFQTALRAPLALVEKVAKPLMEHFVPRMKAAAVYKLAQMHLDQKPNMSPMELRQRLQEDVRSGNNRFGQMTYDNLHLHKTVKDLMMMMTRSLGWNWGSFAEIGGGIKDWAKFAKDASIYAGKKIAGGGKGGKPPAEGGNENADDYEPSGAKFPRITNKMAYVVALPLIVGIFGAVLAAYFGQPIRRLRDYYAIKTGEVDDHGKPVIVELPSYMKDVLSFGRHPMQAVINKLHPILSMIGNMLSNKDFFGVEIRHEGDPIMKQILQELKFAGKQLAPFSLTNIGKIKGSDVSPALKIATAAGALIVAPSSAGKSDAQNLADDLVAESLPKNARTQEQAEHTKLRSQMIGLQRIGKGAPEMAQAVAQGKLNAHDVAYIRKQASLTPLQASIAHLNAQDAEKVEAVATPEEKQQIRPMIAKKEAKTSRPMFSGF